MMRVLFIASECAPFVKTGGLADVVSAMPRALAECGIETRILLPGYPDVIGALGRKTRATKLPDLLGEPVQLLAGSADGLDIVALEASDLFDRPGNPYLGPNGQDWPDNPLRFGALGRAGAHIALEGLEGWRPDVVHVHDWQAGLTPAYLSLSGRDHPPSIATIHNIVFQGVFPAEYRMVLDMPAAGFHVNGYEYYGSISFLKAALMYADAVTTVSPTYARELMTVEYGMGLDGVIAARSDVLTGILNGVDLDVWNPGTDPHIARTYSARSLARKAENKAALEEEFGLTPEPDRPLFCIVSRLTRQKGLDLVLDALPGLLERGGRLVVLGTGEADIEDGYRHAARQHAGHVGAVLGYDEALSHRMQGGADAIIIPSRFEPCGLTQLYGLRYGTLPVVSRTGGLADTVIDANDAALRAGVATGFQFAPVTGTALAATLDRVCDLFEDRPVWQGIMRRAMRHPVGWDTSAAAYADLYGSLIAS